MVKWLLITSLLTSFLTLSCQNHKDLSSQIKISGSTTMDPLMNLITEVYRQENPNIALSYEAFGSSVGIKNLLNDTADVAASSRELTQEEVSKSLLTYPIGLDGLAIIVNNDTDVFHLDLEHLSSIFEGKIKNWKEIGGPDLPITLIKRDDSSGTYVSFKELVLKNKDYALEGLVVNSNGDAMSKVEHTKGSISYLGMSYLSEIDKNQCHVVKVNGIFPDYKSVTSQSYPLAREIYLITKKNPKTNTKNLINFVLSQEGQELVGSAGFFPINP